MNLKLNRQMLRVLEALEFRDDVGVLMLSGKGTGSRELFGNEGRKTCIRH